MKRGHSLALGLLALALYACGGSGSDNDDSSTPIGLTNTPRIEAVLANQNVDPNYVYQDLLNIQVTDSLVFQLVNYDANGNRNVLNNVTFRTNDSSNRAGLLTETTGQYTAGNTDTGNNNYILTARYDGVDYSSFYKVNPRQILLRGKVLAEGTNVPVYNATIDFYAPSNPIDNTGVQVTVATVRTAADGTYRVSLPAFNDNVSTSADAAAAAKIQFTIRSGALPDGYYPHFVFKGKRYDAGSGLCRPTLLSNQQVSDENGTEFLPYKSGDRYLIDSADTDNFSNGTILLTPRSDAFPTKPEANGCTTDAPVQ